MGNSPPARVKSPDEIRDDFDKAFNPDRNGVGTAFRQFGDDVKNTGNDILQKIETGTQEAFKKDGIGNQILRKAGDIAGTVAPVLDGLGNGALTLSALQPELAPVLAPVGLGLKGGGQVGDVLGKKLPQVADTIEKPRRDLKAKDITETIFR
jgi:hypothetical protein